MRTVTLLLLLFSLLTAGHDEHREHHFPMDIGYLDLTRQQHEAVEKIVRNYRKAHHRFNRHQKETRNAITRLFVADRFDRARFVALQSQLRSEAEAVEADFLSAIHAVLTPEQRQRFAGYMEEWEIE